ncbi:MAG: polyprenol monophosphomannose synthase [Candidatus Sumerlaeia bacterium]|nr:polyprenol monophosphomannose synthase [Candidatus Sumerlaeia bacterium]
MDAVVIATFNEAQNAPEIVREVLEAVPHAHVIIVDDDSPDGTARVVEELGLKNVHIIVRKKKRGYGTAVRDGLREAIRMGAERVATMDADFSHDPADLGRLLEELKEADMVIGSRYIGGVRVINWHPKRLLLSLFANSYVRLVLGLRAQDCTSGYRAYRAKLLRRMKLASIESNGYSFLVEMLWRARQRQARIIEVPIIFTERREGQSKMSGGVITESAFMPWRLRLYSLFR